MASSAIIPEPNAEGYYSKALNARYEQLFMDSIQEGAVAFSPVDLSNAGELLFLIWNEPLSKLICACPPQFSTRELCNSHIQRHPDLVPLLAAVHEKKAYAWLCEHSMQCYPFEVQLIDTLAE
jgi:hypothetical protein